MTDGKIVRKLIRALGQSQAERAAPELSPDFVRFDERAPEDLLTFSRRLASLVRYFADDDAGTPAGDWTSLFPPTDPSLSTYLEERAGRVPPHLALLLTFFDLYGGPQEVANGITARHLDFFYQDVLRLRKRPPVPDRVHVLVELKKGAPPLLIGPGHVLSAGKDPTGVERRYAPVGETVINRSRVDSLRSVFVDPDDGGTVRFAPIADSADGLGGPFEAEPRWRAFGHPELPRAEVGFAIASPVLRMSEGTRKVTLKLGVAGLAGTRLDGDALGAAFVVFLTGEKGWIEAPSPDVFIDGGDTLRWEMTLPPTVPPVVDYQRDVHGYTYATSAPVVQLVLKPDPERPVAGYHDLRGLILQRASVDVDVSGVTSLTLGSDAGALDPSKAFLPFGPQPTRGSRLMISYPEALQKKLSRVGLKVQWKDPPVSFATHYANYGVGRVDNDDFTVAVDFQDGAGTAFSDLSDALFHPSNARLERELVFTPGSASVAVALPLADLVGALSGAGSAWSAWKARQLILAEPILFALRPTPAAREGFITLTLNRGFLHAEYRKKYVENVVTYAKEDVDLIVLNEPYTPVVQSISLSYRAYSDAVPISSFSEAAFGNADVQFYQLTPFGPLREHGYLREQLSMPSGTDVSLLPDIPHRGELLIGLVDLSPGESVSLLFQVAEGSADPELTREDVLWFALCDNHWKRLGAEELVLDTTNGLLTSGLVKLVVPGAATTANTMLPEGRIWIKAAVRENVDAVSQLVAVRANAVEARFVDHGNDPAHLERALPAGSITKLRTGLAPVKKVLQPYASFGASPTEEDTAFRTRVSERLRHKDRAVSAWDHERIVLAAFPSVHRVKCVPHAKEGSWTAPGHVLLVVVPDLRNRNAVDPLQPRVGADLLTRIEAHVRARTGPQTSVTVRNPRYQKIRLDFRVRFRTGFEFNHYRSVLETNLIRALSPWAFEAGREIAFGGVIYKSVLLNLVERLHYVDYVTDFRMYSFTGARVDARDRDEARPETPDAILVSDGGHTIAEAP